MYTYITKISASELYSVKYPISIIIADGTNMTISRDAELQAAITALLKIEEAKVLALQNIKKLETILVNGKFKVDLYVNAGVNSATNYKDYTMDFANNLSIAATTIVNATVTSMYIVSSQIDVFLKLNFSGNTSFTLPNNTWKVTSFTATTITIQSRTNAAVTLVLKQI